MATYVKGDAVANASGYELLEKVGETYNSLAEASEINFEVSAMDFTAGDHLLAVKAKGDGVNYSDSDPSETVTYTVAAAPVEVTYVEGEYLKRDGTFVAGAGWTRTDYIDVSEHKNFKYTGTTPSGGISNTSAVSGFDANKAFLEIILYPKTEDYVNGYEFSVTNADVAYIAACAYTKNGETFVIESV